MIVLFQMDAPRTPAKFEPLNVSGLLVAAFSMIESSDKAHGNIPIVHVINLDDGDIVHSRRSLIDVLKTCKTLQCRITVRGTLSR